MLVDLAARVEAVHADAVKRTARAAAIKRHARLRIDLPPHPAETHLRVRESVMLRPMIIQELKGEEKRPTPGIAQLLLLLPLQPLPQLGPHSALRRRRCEPTP